MHTNYLCLQQDKHRSSLLIIDIDIFNTLVVHEQYPCNKCKIALFKYLRLRIFFCIIDKPMPLVWFLDHGCVHLIKQISNENGFILRVLHFMLNHLKILTLSVMQLNHDLKYQF